MHSFRSVLLIRHSEAEKTLRQVHGGSGTPLTSRGRDDTRDLASTLRQWNSLSSDTAIFAGPRPQARETASILGRELLLAVHDQPSFRNIGMGIFDGLTDDAARSRDPAAMARLEAWRLGRATVEDIKIPEAETLMDFLHRVDDGLRYIAAVSWNPIIVTTRSLGIAIINILTGYLDGKRTGYLRYRFDAGSITLLENSPSGWNISIHNDTGYLAGDRDFKDD